MLFGLFRRRSRETEHKTYCEIVSQARQEIFYTHYHVPDTVDGRFDMIVVHAVLLFGRMRGEGPKVQTFSQSVFDLFFHDMDASLREMGVSDVRVPKKIKVMGEAFYGRADVYGQALEAGNREELAAALGRNLYTDAATPVAEAALAAYMIAAHEHLKGLATADLMRGQLSWPDPEDFKPAA